MKILDDIRRKYNLLAVSEILDPRDIEIGVKYTDIIQIGFRNMQNYSLLKEIGKINHPILLKRGMMAIQLMNFCLRLNTLLQMEMKTL